MPHFDRRGRRWGATWRSSIAARSVRPARTGAGTLFSASERVATLSPMDEVFAHFRLVSLIARGGMSEVYVADRTGPMGVVQRVCLKVIFSADSNDLEWIRRFKREARIAATLGHANIVTMHEFGQHQGRWWMSLELVDGVTLRALMSSHANAGTRMPFDVVYLIAVELAKALAYLHAQTDAEGDYAPVVHRDVTPTNIFVSTAGSVKLGDFGIATVLHKERTRSRGVGGKAGYMSPEQGAQRPDLYPVDHRTDLFSVGVVLFELLTGTRPYAGPTDVREMLNVYNGERTHDLRELAPDTPEAFARIVDALTESKPEARVQSAAALLSALGGDAVLRLGAMSRAVKGAADAEAREGVADVDRNGRNHR
jgi:serine/threonine protein kinase